MSSTTPPPADSAVLKGLDRYAQDASQVLFWSPTQREAAFRQMSALAPHAPIAAGPTVRPLPTGAPLRLNLDLDAYMHTRRTAGLLVLHRGEIRLERYGLGFSGAERWTSFSIAKSITSTLAGVAIARGSMRGVDEPIVRHLPELAGSGYAEVTLGQLLNMRSGVRWNEDYGDPHSDIARFFAPRDVPAGMDPTLAYMRTLPSVAAPGTRWNYSTGETALVGVLLRRAVGGSLAALLSQAVWAPWGMEAEGGWMIDGAGQEAGGCCMIARLRDWGRLALFVLADGVIDGRRVVPEGWFAQATSALSETDKPGQGYGYQWWTTEEGCVEARGIFGQLLHIDRERQVVLAMFSAWPVATDDDHREARDHLVAAIKAAL